MKRGATRTPLTLTNLNMKKPLSDPHDRNTTFYRDKV